MTKQLYRVFLNLVSSVESCVDWDIEELASVSFICCVGIDEDGEGEVNCDVSTDDDGDGFDDNVSLAGALIMGTGGGAT